MLTQLSLSPSQSQFIALLKYYNLYQPTELYKVVCPFHPDKNASMQINLSNSFFYCYGCGCKGSTFELYKYFQQKKSNNIKKDNGATKGAKQTDLQLRILLNKLLTKLLSKYNYTKRKYIKENTYSFVESNAFSFVDNKLNYKEGIKLARNYYNNLPTPNWYRPSLNPVIEEETRLCLQYMKQRGFTPHTLTKFGAKPSLNKYYPICIPLLENGLLRGYVMRTFDKEIEQQRKYMYNKGFKRELILPGTYAKNEPIVLVEGYIDFLKAKQIGIKNCAPLLGWKISSHQLEKLRKKGITKILCALDNDEAGIKGYRYLKRLEKSKMVSSVKRIHYPKNCKDMGDIVKGSQEAQLILQQIAYLQTY